MIKLFKQPRRVSFFQPIRSSFRPILHPIDRRMAKHWIKQRLVAVFRELRNDPRALEAAYQALSLKPRPGQEERDGEMVFELNIPGEQ